MPAVAAAFFLSLNLNARSLSLSLSSLSLSLPRSLSSLSLCRMYMQVQFPRITTKVQVPPNTLGLIKSNSFRAPVGGAAAGSPSPTGAGLDSSRSFGTSRPVTPGSPVATTPKHSTKNAFPARSQRS